MDENKKIPFLLSINTPNLLLQASKDSNKVYQFIRSLFPDSRPDYIEEKFHKGHILLIYYGLDIHNKKRMIYFLASFLPEKHSNPLEIEQLLDLFVYFNCYYSESIRQYILKLPDSERFPFCDTYLHWDNFPIDIKTAALKEYHNCGYTEMVSENFYLTA